MNQTLEGPHPSDKLVKAAAPVSRDASSDMSSSIARPTAFPGTISKMETDLLHRHCRLLSILSILLGSIALLSLIPTLILPAFSISAGNTSSWLTVGLCLAVAAISMVSYQLARRQTRLFFRLGAYLLLTVEFLGISGALLTAPLSSSPTAIFYFPVLVCLALLLSPLETVGWSIACILVLCLNFFLTGYLNLLNYSPAEFEKVQVQSAVALGCYCTVIIAIEVCLFYFVKSLNTAFVQIETQTHDLYQNSLEMEKKGQLGLAIGQKLVESSKELTQTVLEQSAANQQLVVLTDSTVASIEKLAISSQAIERRLEDIRATSNETSLSAAQLEVNARIATQNGLSGQEAVTQTQVATQMVAAQINVLTNRLEELQQLSGEADQIINVITSIANETHLLSLNAAIESAGAGAEGARFGVISNEIKGLANRSLNSSRQVLEIVRKLQQAMAKTANEAGLSLEQTHSATQIAGRAGVAITDLVEVINTTTVASQGINHRNGEIKRLLDQIITSNALQQLEREQIYVMTSQVKATSFQNSFAINQISNEALGLRNLADQLTQTLAPLT